MSNRWRDFEAKVRPLYIVLAFLVCFMAASKCEAEMRYEIGGGFLSGEFSNGGSLMFAEKFPNNWNVGMGYISEQEVTDRSGTTYDVRENLWASAWKSVYWKQMELGLGVAYFNDTNRALGTNFTAHVALGWNWSDSASITLRHFSNAGSGTPNMGQDMLMLGWRF